MHGHQLNLCARNLPIHCMYHTSMISCIPATIFAQNIDHTCWQHCGIYSLHQQNLHTIVCQQIAPMISTLQYIDTLIWQLVGYGNFHKSTTSRHYLTWFMTQHCEYNNVHVYAIMYIHCCCVLYYRLDVHVYVPRLVSRWIGSYIVW